jgi:hypothetical protein
MQDTELEDLQAKHGMLMKVCGARFSKEDEQRLLALSDERAFCVACVAREPRMEFLLKLFTLQKDFQEIAPVPPAPDESSARAYLDDCLARVKAKAEEVPLSEAIAIGRDAVLKFGAHFSGKLIHSSARGAFLLAPIAKTGQPHLSSRRLQAVGLPLPLDQSELDNGGVYQRVLKVLNDDPLLAEVGLDLALIEAIRQGGAEALSEPFRPKTVDHRLRQVLLPDGDEYLAVSPLAAGGMSVLLHEAAKSLGAEAPADAPVKPPQTTKRGRPRKATKAQGAEGGVEGTAALSEDTPKPKPIFLRIGLPFGGGIPRNASLHPRKAIQESFFFGAPQRSANISEAWRFVFRSWSPRITKTAAKAVAAQVARMNDSPVFQDSVSLAAVDVQSHGALGALARQCHDQAIDFARRLSETSFVDNGEEVEIDEALLRARRPREPTALDLAIVHQNFGQDYRMAMAKSIVEALRRLTMDSKTGQDVFDNEIGRRRAALVIEKALESPL